MEKGKDSKNFFGDLVVRRVIKVAQDVGASPYVVRHLGQIARNHVDELTEIEQEGWGKAAEIAFHGSKGQQLIRMSQYGVTNQDELFIKSGVSNLSKKMELIKSILELDKDKYKPQVWREIQAVLDRMFPEL